MRRSLFGASFLTFLVNYLRGGYELVTHEERFSFFMTSAVAMWPSRVLQDKPRFVCGLSVPAEVKDMKEKNSQKSRYLHE